MVIKITLKRVLIVIIGLVVIQIITFNVLSPYLLKRKLLGGVLGVMINHNADSAFVRNFYTDACVVQDGFYTTIKGTDEQNFLKDRLKVNYIRFANRDTFNWDDDKSFGVSYNAYQWNNFDNGIGNAFFRTNVTEELRLGSKEDYYRRLTCYWFLFFWVESFEFFELIEH